MASSIAFFWADEPSALSVPPPWGQSDAAALDDDEPEAPASEPVLLSEPHADSAREPTMATLATRPRRWIFTVFKPLHREIRGGLTCPTTLKVGRHGDAVARRG